MSKPKRIVDVKGDVIVSPEGYHPALDAVRDMIDSMVTDGVDRSDVYVILASLWRDVDFHLQFYADR